MKYIGTCVLFYYSNEFLLAFNGEGHNRICCAYSTFCMQQNSRKFITILGQFSTIMKRRH